MFPQIYLVPFCSSKSVHFFKFSFEEIYFSDKILEPRKPKIVKITYQSRATHDFRKNCILKGEMFEEETYLIKNTTKFKDFNLPKHTSSGFFLSIKLSI